jgi:hypothetical protein
MKALEPLRRMQHQNWFELIGAVNSQIATAFSIGSACDYTANVSGELTCFANDVEAFYWNNYGEVVLVVMRTA